MASSLYILAEKAKDILGFGDIQALVSSAIDCYATVVKKEWYEGKQDGTSEISGAFVYTFKGLTPVKDTDVNMYYINVPSSYINLPHEMGINSVSSMLYQDSPFTRIGSGSNGMWKNLKSSGFGGSQPYYTESSRIYFPKMTSLNAGDILLKLALSLQTVDPEEELNIAPNIGSMIVDMLVAKYKDKPELKPNAL